MANNKELKDANDVTFITKTTETAGVNVAHVNIDNITQPLTDAQLRASSVPVSTGLNPLTDAQLRAAAVPVSLASQPLPTGAATEAKQDAEITQLTNLNNSQGAQADAVASSDTGTFSLIALIKRLLTKLPGVGQQTMANSQPVVIASDQSPVQVNLPAGTEVVGTAQTVINTDLLTGNVNGWYDAAAFQSASIQIIGSAGISAGAIFFEQTNDNSSSAGIPLPAQEVSVLNSNPQVAAITIAASANRMFRMGVSARYIRVRISTAFTGGTVLARAFFSDFPYSSPVVNVQQATAASLNATIASPTIAASTNLIGDVGQQYRANATGAGTITNINCPATPAVQTIKGSAGRLLGIYLVNTNATIRYLKLFNILSPTLASSAASLRVPLPQNQPVYIAFEGGLGFGTAITCAVCSTASLTDATGAVTLDDVTGFSVHA